MIKFILFLLLITICNSCFLFSDLKRTRFQFTQSGQPYIVSTVVPKRYSESKKIVDSIGNQVQYYYYSGGAILYFAFLKDTTTELQPINYELNIPKELYRTIYFKGVDSTNQYWRETRFKNYKAGYANVYEDGAFDSSVNHFSLHMNR